MTIENGRAYLAGLWDWSALDGCFGGCAPTDLDGLVERNGQFLAFETKNHAPRPLPQGQHITFEALRQTRRFTVVMVWGAPGAPVAAQVWAPDAISAVRPCDMGGLRRISRAWFVLADQCLPVTLAGIERGAR